MAKQTSRNTGVAAALGAAARTAHEAHKSDETTYGGGGNLPAGIEGGIAQLVLSKFDTFKSGDNQGEYYYMAQGIVIEPFEHEGRRVKGLRTRIGPEPLCNTPNSKSRPDLDSHIAWMYNEWRKLGIDTEGIDPNDWESVSDALQAEGPYFEFRTWQGKPTEQYPNPRVNEDWRGIKEGYVPPEDESEEEDNTAEESPVSRTAKKKKAVAKAAVKPTKGSKKKAAAEDDGPSYEEEEAEDVETEEETGEEEPDLDALATAADGGDEDAQAALIELAEEAGLDHESFPLWVDLAAELQSGEGGEEEEEEEETVEAPEKGVAVYHKPKGARARVECTIQLVNMETKVCTLKNLDDGKLYKAVPWGVISLDKAGKDVPWADGIPS